MDMTIQELYGLGLKHHQSGQLAEADRYYRQVLAMAPDHADALHMLGMLAYQERRLDAAADLIGQALRSNPADSACHHNLGLVLSDLGRVEAAAASYERALALRPDFPEALTNLGFALMRLGQLERAMICYEQVSNLKPNSAEAYYNIGIACFAQGHLDEAIAHYGLAVAFRPDFPDALNNLGFAFYRRGKRAQAAACYERALGFRPDFVEALTNLGFVQLELERTEQAIACFERTVTIKPEAADTHYNQGLALFRLGKSAEAIICFERALAIRPEHAEACNAIGLALKKLSRHDEALSWYRKALAIKPDLADTHVNIGLVLMDQGKIDEALTCCEQALVIKPDFALAHNNLLFTLNYHPDAGAEDIFREYRRWNERWGLPLLPASISHANDCTPNRRLKIGYVSPDFRRHSAKFFIEPLLASHDKTQVEVYAYSEVIKDDDVTEKIKACVDHWFHTVGIDDDELTNRVRADGIDILVDLAGHTFGSRLRVFGRKPAPIQVSWLGYGYTTGLSAVDYFLGDPVFTPPGCESLFAERIWRLPCFAAYRPPAEWMGDPGPLPALTRGHVTFGTLTRPIRINHRVVRVWAEILKRVPEARLVVNSDGFHVDGMKRDLASRFAAHGIAPERLLMGYDTPPWDVLRGLDIGLDCFPHNSGTTLYENLYMGVPFVTLAERPSVGRMGAAILAGAGHAEWTALSEDEYMEKAVLLASDLPRLQAIRANLRSEMMHSPLMDERGFARSVEAAYRAMWQRYCDGGQRHYEATT